MRCTGDYAAIFVKKIIPEQENVVAVKPLRYDIILLAIALQRLWLHQVILSF